MKPRCPVPGDNLRRGRPRCPLVITSKRSCLGNHLATINYVDLIHSDRAGLLGDFDPANWPYDRSCGPCAGLELAHRNGLGKRPRDQLWHLSLDDDAELRMRTPNWTSRQDGMDAALLRYPVPQLWIYVAEDVVNVLLTTS